MEVRNDSYNSYAPGTFATLGFGFNYLPVYVFLGQYFTLSTLQIELQVRQNVDVGIGSLQTILQHLCFKYEQEDNRRTLTEKSSIAVKRSQLFISSTWRTKI